MLLNWQKTALKWRAAVVEAVNDLKSSDVGTRSGMCSFCDHTETRRLVTYRTGPPTTTSIQRCHNYPACILVRSSRASEISRHRTQPLTKTTQGVAVCNRNIDPLKVRNSFRLCTARSTPASFRVENIRHCPVSA